MIITVVLTNLRVIKKYFSLPTIRNRNNSVIVMKNIF